MRQTFLDLNPYQKETFPTHALHHIKKEMCFFSLLQRIENHRNQKKKK